MGRRDLRKQYKELEFNFVDLVSLLDTTPNKKVTPFLVKQFYDWIQYPPDEKRDGSEEYQKMKHYLGEPKNDLDELFKRMVFKWAQPKLEIIDEFTEHMKNNRLPENDINKYDNWNAVKLAINEAEIKMGSKNKKNKVMILHHDDEWLVLKPLSVEASVNYGYGTKWCTSMRKDNTYFHKYSKDGVLLFVINRKNGIKYAFYSSPKEYSVWTTTDARIDSMETTIPFDLLIKIKDWTNFDVVGPNYDYFDEEDKQQKPKLKTLFPEPTMVEARVTRGDLEVIRETLERAEDEIVTEPMGEEVGMESMEEAPVEVTFRADDWEEDAMIDEEVNDMGYDEEAERDIPFVSISNWDNDEPMVGYEHPVHGSITEQGERTWENPYPNGPGGGFENETLEAPDREYVVQEMGVRAHEEDELPQQAG